MLQTFNFPPHSGAEDRQAPVSPSRYITPRPIAPAPAPGRASHRRGLSLDQGVAGHQQKNTQDTLDWSRWLDAGDHKANSGSDIPRPRTPVQETNDGALISLLLMAMQQLTSPFLQEESFLLTPATTPRWKPTAIPPRGCRTAHSSPTKKAPPQLLPRTSERMQRARSFQGPSGGYPPHQDQPSFSDVPLFQLPHRLDLNLPKEEKAVFEELTVQTPDDNADPFVFGTLPSPTMTSFSSINETPNASIADLVDRRAKKVPIAPASVPALVPLLPSRPRTGSSSACASPIKAALANRVVTIADLKLDSSIDASLEETGITLEDICGYIEGPDPTDNKWVCTFDGCLKRFGRKENIKSHVQTHLGDRQFKCNHCNKSFVRGHDLKRHAKIHTGVKPYPCDCGNSFARHDALTRHKQRGMCSGAFVGAVRRAERRGRPKKDKLSFEERREKASRSRQRERKKALSPPAHDSSSSCSSAPSPESDACDSTSAREHSPLKETLFLNMEAISLPPNAFAYTPPASPGYSTGNISSPARSYYSTSQEPDEALLCLSPSKRYLADIPEEILDLPSLDCGSPTPVKRESKRDLTGSPCRTLWPASAGTTLLDEPRNDFDDVFSSQTCSSVFDDTQLPPLGPQSTTGISESGSSQYDDDIFLRQLTQEGSHLDGDYFHLPLSPQTDSFFDSFTTELK